MIKLLVFRQKKLFPSIVMPAKAGLVAKTPNSANLKNLNYLTQPILPGVLLPHGYLPSQV
jgi:hypothetical protein